MAFPLKTNPASVASFFISCREQPWRYSFCRLRGSLSFSKSSSLLLTSPAASTSAAALATRAASCCSARAASVEARNFASFMAPSSSAFFTRAASSASFSLAPTSAPASLSTRAASTRLTVSSTALTPWDVVLLLDETVKSPGVGSAWMSPGGGAAGGTTWRV